MDPNLFPLEIVRAVETRARLPQEALGFSEAEHVTLPVELWKTKTILSLLLLGPWLESESGLLPLSRCPSPWRAGTQQGHVTSVWGQTEGLMSWWCAGFTQEAITDTVVEMLLPSTELLSNAACCLYGLLLEMFYLGIECQTMSWTKQERRVNRLIFTNVSTSKDLVYVRSLDSNIYKHTQKSA